MLHQPDEQSSGIQEFRKLHDDVNKNVASIYGWSDILSDSGFGLDYLDADDECLLPRDLQERIDSGNLFFPSASEACAFQSQLRQYGAVKASKKLPWRYRWPDAVRDDVLARLLALNAERFAEEQETGLQSNVKSRKISPQGRPRKNSKTTAHSEDQGTLGLEQYTLEI